MALFTVRLPQGYPYCADRPTASADMPQLSLARLSTATLALASLFAAAPNLPAAAGPATATGACEQPKRGRYAVMAMGTLISGDVTTPQARLLEERWLPGGAIEGRIIERVGSTLRSGTYRGSVRMVGSCLARVERSLPWGAQQSEAVLDSRGRPLYSLDRGRGTVISSRWLPMAPGSCRADDLNGTVLSSQVGLNRRPGTQGWTPNAVIQREQWQHGSVRGVALSSYGGVGDTSSYSGRMQLEAGSCWGELVEQDQKGTRYHYSSLLVKGRSGARGYLYLQRDADDLSVGWLVRD
ncbi:MAG: hypothetical protein RLZZ611_739 [Cyanobacteriota bacterium]